MKSKILDGIILPNDMTEHENCWVVFIDKKIARLYRASIYSHLEIRPKFPREEWGGYIEAQDIPLLVSRDGLECVYITS